MSWHERCQKVSEPTKCQGTFSGQSMQATIYKSKSTMQATIYKSKSTMQAINAALMMKTGTIADQSTPPPT